MSSPYRESGFPALQCPRCTAPMPARDVTACMDDHGIWVDASAAAEAFEAAELRPSRLTRWARPYAACPHCEKTMTLFGHDMSRFLGCDGHGFWVDSDIVPNTGLRRRSAAARVEQARAAAAEQKDAARRAVEAARLAEEAARRAAEEAREAARAAEEARLEAIAAREREEAEARARRERDAALIPYIAIVRAATDSGDPTRLAELLMRLEQAVQRLGGQTR